MEKDDSVKLVAEIETAFNRLIGQIAIMSKLDSYAPDKEELNDLLDIISNWGAKFQLQLNLSFISSEELLDIYNRLDKLKEKYLYESSLGDEAELSDKAVIWMWELMLLRKKQIEGNETK